jgi:FemAB-related protein (PEP-CTERM system-associated)
MGLPASYGSRESPICCPAMRVEEADEPGGDWDAFAADQDGRELGHAAAWARVLQDGYGLETRYLACRDPSGELAGVLPLCEIRTLKGQRELVSLPFHDTAGVLASGEASSRALVEAALGVARERGCSALELRQASRSPGLPAADEECSPGRVGLVLPLESSEEAQWSSVRAKVRNQVRKAHKEGLELAEWEPPDLLDGFYECFAINMRDLGSPVHAKRFFGAMAEAFGERLRFIVAADRRRAVGGLVAIQTGNRVTVPWASTLRSERRRCPNNLIYWEALRWAVARGASQFDFGRSPVDGGTYRFKRGWGAQERPLPWLRLSPQGQPLPLSALGESRTLVGLSSLWSRLPVSLTRQLGPRLRRHISN